MLHPTQELEPPANPARFTIYRVDVDALALEKVHTDAKCSFASLAISADGLLYAADIGVFSGAGAIYTLRPDGSEVQLLIDNVDGSPFYPDDLIFDANGSLYFNDMTGTVNHPTGRILRRTPKGDISVIIDGLASPNGMAFNPDGTVMWVTEHKANRLLGCKITPAGELGGLFPQSGITVFAHLNGGEADSVTVDADGHVYVAMIRSGRVEVFDDQGHSQAVIRVPGGRRAHPTTSHVAIKPGSREGYLVAGGPDGATLFAFDALGAGLPAVRKR